METKEWISEEVRARYAGHDQVMGMITWLLVVLVLLDINLLNMERRSVLLVVLWSTAMVVYKLVSQPLKDRAQLKASLDLAVLLIYVVAVCWFTGKTQSPFISVVYLILMATSLTQRRRITYLMAAFAVALYLLLTAFELHPFSTDFAVDLVKLLPFILIAHIGTMLSDQAEQARAEVERLSLTDDLTDLNNMRSFEALALQQERVSKRYGSPFAICMLDADNLKQINDRFGHLAGTELIKWTARIIRSNIREADVAARFGGDEFIVMFNEHTKEQIRPAVERIVRAMATCPFSYRGELVECTLSAGIASFPDDGLDLRSVIQRADEAMYDSKRVGKNCVSLAGAQEGGTSEVGGEELGGRIPHLDGQRTPVHFREGDLPR